MKKPTRLITVFAILFLTLSCGSDDAPKEPEQVVDLTGNWRLIERLSDPGDGSGTFEAVSSSKRLTFDSDGSVTVNDGTLCSFSESGSGSGMGTYDTTKKEIEVNGCDSKISYSFAGSNLILSYQCIEACQEKYMYLGQ